MRYNDKIFTKISKKVLDGETRSALSDRPAEIIHHMERRLTRPDLILEASNLIPLSAEEHDAVHRGEIILEEKDGVVFCTDKRWKREVRLRLYLSDFRDKWNKTKGAVLRG